MVVSAIIVPCSKEVCHTHGIAVRTIRKNVIGEGKRESRERILVDKVVKICICVKD